MAAQLDERLERYAAVAIEVGANVEAGQNVFVSARIEHAPLARALARAAYGAGARYVDVAYSDQHVRRAMIELGPDEALSYSPPWLVARYEQMDGQAMVGTAGDPEPTLLADLDGERVGRARMREVAAVAMRQLQERSVNWTGIAYPNEGWAKQMFGEPDVERLWEAVAFCTSNKDEAKCSENGWRNLASGLRRADVPTQKHRRKTMANWRTGSRHSNLIKDQGSWHEKHFR